MPNKPLGYDQHYHIYNRGNNRENLFVEQRHYPYFLELYAKYIHPVADTLAYCLLPNHFHFAVRTRSESEQESYYYEEMKYENVRPPKPFKLCEPSRAFNNFFIAYARAFNSATERTGVLFASPFHRKLIDSDNYLRRLIIYIHRNPQHHGFVENFRDWPWISYGAIESDKPSTIYRNGVLALYENQHQFLACHAGEPVLDQEFE